MCHPGFLALGAAAVGAAGQLQAGTYAARMARFEAQVADQNKARVREGALDALGRGQADQRQLGRDVAGRIGAQTARMAGNNVDITFGSAARLIEDTRMIGQEDSDALAENIRRQVSGMQTDIWNFESEKRAKRAEASQAKTAAGLARLRRCWAAPRSMQTSADGGRADCSERN